jgi:diphthamide biosynthesis protein 7
MRVDSSSLEEVSRFDTDGILDCKWSGNGSLANLALSTGHLQILQLHEGDLNLVEESKVEVDASGIALSLDVSPLTGQTVVSCSNGNVGLVEAAAFETAELWKAHHAEVWCASLDRHDPHLAYTASDDYSFAGWDTRSLHEGPAFGSRFHSAGVCTVTSDPHREHLFATGSYDEQAALWDTRMLTRPLSLFKAGSGVWRLRWHPEQQGCLLAACMHDGFYVLREAEGGFEAKGHVPSASLAYGADWIAADCFGGATFYNHTAMLYKLDE